MPARARSTAPAQLGEDRTILIVEDDPSCRSALHHYFERSGYRVSEATDGPGFAAAVFQSSADLVILDLGLPGFDGYDVLAKIRRDSAVPVIVCSGRDSESERDAHAESGGGRLRGEAVLVPRARGRVRAVLRRGAMRRSTAACTTATW